MSLFTHVLFRPHLENHIHPGLPGKKDKDCEKEKQKQNQFKGLGLFRKEMKTFMGTGERNRFRLNKKMIKLSISQGQLEIQWYESASNWTFNSSELSSGALSKDGTGANSSYEGPPDRGAENTANRFCVEPGE